MSSNPYLLDLPAVVSFSGGRTSGFMLRHILDAHGGQPEDLVVSFQNTGLEHAKTYEFITQVEDAWDLDLVWLEYTLTEDGKASHRVVDSDSYRSKGEPFSELIEKKNYLPNPVARLCTENLKIRALGQYLKGLPAFAGNYTHAIGLRFDEPKRALRTRGPKGKQEVVCPLYDAEVDQEQVLAWWSEQPFDLELPMGGNLAGIGVGCFLMGRLQLEELMTAMPEYFDWWVKAEQTPLNSKPEGGQFRSDRPSYAQMREILDRQGWLFDPNGPTDATIPCMCTD